MSERYFLKADWQEEWTEVTMEQFMAAERNAGFRSYTEGRPATGGFSGNGLRGKITLTDPAEAQNSGKPQI